MKKTLLGAALGGVLAAVIMVVAGWIFFRTWIPQMIATSGDNQMPGQWPGSRGMMGRGGGHFRPGMMNTPFGRDECRPGMLGRGFDRRNPGPGMMQRWNNDDASLRGWMHEGMVAAMAEKLGLSAVDLQSRLDKGDTMYDVAITEGLTVEEFQTMIMDARTSAIEQALADGRITQKQADWMKARDDIRGFGKGGGFPHGFPWSKNDPSLVTTPTPGS